MSGRIVMPGERTEIDDAIRNATHCKQGPRYTKLVCDLLKRVCSTFLLDPVKLADFTPEDVRYSHHPRQLAFVEYDCVWDVHASVGPDSCKGFLHIRRWNTCVYGKHWKVLGFDGTANEVCAKLRVYFGSITSGPRAAADRISLPEIDSLEDRVGLTDFMRGL